LTRDEYLDWCRKRALEHLDAGDLTHAVASMASDLKTHHNRRKYRTRSASEHSTLTRGDRQVVFAKACELDLEGIVSKREGSFYRCGRSRNWLKAKNPDFVRTGPPCLEGTARDFLPPRLGIASAAVMPTKKISREQLRDALALIGMKHEELAEAARVSPAAIAEFERGERVLHERTFVAVIEALEARGVEFSDGGVKMR
jgi:Helix-turn-helix